MCDLAVSLSATHFFLEFKGKGGGGRGLLVLAFFLQTTQNAVVLTSGLSVLWQVIRMQYCSDPLLLECIVKRLEYD